MSDGPLNFEEYRRRREENASTVRCARCRRWIAATATKCLERGAHFQGEAQDFTPDESNSAEGKVPKWVVVLAALLLLAMVVGGLGVR